MLKVNICGTYDAEWLGLEITEGVLMHGTDACVELIRELKALGLRVSIDDFGTGYSSLGYLKHLPVDYLKIDKTFTQGIGTHSEDEAITSAIVALGHILGLEVVAEGVENLQQLEFLRP